MSIAYEKWKKSIGRDGPEYNVLNSVNNTELKYLEKDLIENLGYYEVMLLSKMKSINAIPALELIYYNKKISLRDRAISAKSLLIIKEDFKYLSIIIDFSKDSRHVSWIDRQMAITLLTNIKHPKAFEALENLLYDPEYLVRSYAASIYSHNSFKQTSSQTIFNNTKSFDKVKLDKLANLLRNKITP